MLLFSGLGLFSYFLIANYTDFSPKTAEAFYSWGNPQEVLMTIA